MRFLVCRQVLKTYDDGAEAGRGIALVCGEGEFAV